MAGGNPTEAAGGVLWRPAEGGEGVEIALVHRPKYDDWSLPKGKLLAGEHPLIGAIREIEEETGSHAEPGRYLGETRYLKDGKPKRVRYWAMRARDGKFEPSTEVDQLNWLPQSEALRHLPKDHDRPIGAAFLVDVRATRPCVVVRHASAGSRDTWSGDDHERPLDDQGRAQAAALVELLSAYGVRHAFSADVVRCLDTVAPFTALRNLPIDCEPLLSESGFAAHPEAAVERFLEIVAAPEPSVVCTQRVVIPGLIRSAAQRLGHPGVDGTSVGKGAFLVLHLTVGEPAQLVAVDRSAPAA